MSHETFERMVEELDAKVAGQRNDIAALGEKYALMLAKVVRTFDELDEVLRRHISGECTAKEELSAAQTPLHLLAASCRAISRMCDAVKDFNSGNQIESIEDVRLEIRINSENRLSVVNAQLWQQITDMMALSDVVNNGIQTVRSEYDRLEEQMNEIFEFSILFS